MKRGRNKLPGWKLICCLFSFVVGSLAVSGGGGGGGGDIWPLERPEGMTQIQSLEVMCGKDHMDVHLSFTQPFEGIVFSKGQYGDPRCVYVPPATGRTFFSFRIAYARCGTKPDLHGQFYENTVVVQYDKDLLEVWDEAKRLRCEWFNDYEKTASKPPMVIADLDVIQLDFRGDNVDCWMEIQHGKGPWAPPVSGIVPLGSTLTLVVAINDYRGEFDMRVKSCAASDGAGHIIQLSDENGCVLRPKMISRFLKAKGADERASVITYAFFHAFKFPDALSVHIKCKVEICRHGCLDHCELAPNIGGGGGGIPHGGGGPHIPLGHYGGGPLERKDNLQPPPPPPKSQQKPIHDSRPRPQEHEPRPRPQDYEQRPRPQEHEPRPRPQEHEQRPRPQDYEQRPRPQEHEPRPRPQEHELRPRPQEHEPRPRPQETVQSLGDLLYDESISDDYSNMQEPSFSSMGRDPSSVPSQPPKHQAEAPVDEDDEEEEERHPLPKPQYQHDLPKPGNHDGSERFPFGPRNLDTDSMPIIDSSSTSVKSGRRKRSVVVEDQKARNTDVGVSGLYEVISEADLAFTPDSKAEAVTVFQGRIREEVVYGICLPVPGFSALFVLVAVSAVVAALFAGSLLYRYQLQREAQRIAQQQRQRVQGANGSVVNNGWANWMAMRLLRARIHPSTCVATPSLTSNHNRDG